MRIKATTKTRKKTTNEITHFFFGFFFMADTIRAIREMTPPNIPNRPNTAYIQALLSVALVPPLVSHESREVSMMGGEVFLFFGKFWERGLFFLGAIRATHPGPGRLPISPAGGACCAPLLEAALPDPTGQTGKKQLKKSLEKPPAGHMGHFRAHDKLQCAHLEPIAAQRLRSFMGHMGTYL